MPIVILKLIIYPEIGALKKCISLGMETQWEPNTIFNRNSGKKSSDLYHQKYLVYCSKQVSIYIFT